MVIIYQERSSLIARVTPAYLLMVHQLDLRTLLLRIPICGQNCSEIPGRWMSVRVQSLVSGNRPRCFKLIRHVTSGSKVHFVRCLTLKG